MSDSQPQAQQPKLDAEQRFTAYQNKLRALKDGAALREVMERELLLEFIKVNHGNINEYPLLKAQQQSVVGILCGRVGHPGYEFIHKHIANFIVLLAHYGKAVKVNDTARTQQLQTELFNTESMLIKCVQGIVYAMALITDNFEEIVLRYFGQQALSEYSKLIEKHQLDESFWKAFIEQFVASRVEEAHKEILEGKKFTVTKEKNFLVIRFLFDDILSKLNPTSQAIEKTRIQKGYVDSRTNEDGIRRARLMQSVLAKGVELLAKAKDITPTEFLQASRIICVDSVAQDFESKYTERIKQVKAHQDGIKDERDKETIEREQIEFNFTREQVVAVGVGAAIAIGKTSDHFYKALTEFVPDQIAGIRHLERDFSIPVLERILYFLLENIMIHILQETGREYGSKIQVRSGRARRVSEEVVDNLKGMSKIRKKQLFGNDVTREGTLLFKPKAAKQLTGTMDMLSLEPELQAQLVNLWKKAIFRVDIMVLLNLELFARTTTNLKAKLAEVLEKFAAQE